MKLLKQELEIIDGKLRQFKLDREIDRHLFPRKPRVKPEPVACSFTVITEAGNKYPLTAHTTDPKYYATTLHKETDCLVRRGTKS